MNIYDLKPIHPWEGGLLAVTIPSMNTAEIRHFGYDCLGSLAEVAFRNQVEAYDCDFPIRGMLVGENFGVGDLPEEAVRRLWKLGITTVIGSTFADSFRKAAREIGLLCAMVGEETFDRMVRLHQKRKMRYFHAKLAPESSNLRCDFYIVLTSVVGGRISEHSWSHCISFHNDGRTRFQLGMLKILGDDLCRGFAPLGNLVEVELITSLGPKEVGRQAS